MRTIPASQLVLNSEGAIYHLNLHPDQLADNVILVGDPGRVDLVASLFDKVEVKRQNRELVYALSVERNLEFSMFSLTPLPRFALFIGILLLLGLTLPVLTSGRQWFGARKRAKAAPAAGAR